MGIILASTGLPLLTSAGIAAPAAVPVPVPKPEPGEITLRGPVSSISHRGVTFNFSSPVRYILSPAPLSEPIIITHADYLPSGTSVTSISPESVTVAGYAANGAMINPRINTHSSAANAPAWNPEYGQGFDGLSGLGASNDILAYVAGMNDDPAIGGLISIPAGYKGTIVKSVRDPNISSSNTNTNKGPVQKYVPLTFMDSLPPSAGTWFRPAASLDGERMEWTHRVEDVDAALAADVLRNLPAPSNLQSAAWYLNNRVEPEQLYHLPIWCSPGGDRMRRLQLSRELPTNTAYARDLARQRCEIACVLHVSPGVSQSEIAARRSLAIIMTQWGIDIDGCYQMGMTYASGAGQNHGIQTFPFLAAFLLGDTEMLSRARMIRGNAINQLWWVGERHVGYPVEWDPGSQGNGRKVVRQTYHPTDIGIPEWSTGGWNPLDLKPPFAGDITSNLHGLYRDVQFTTQILELFPVALLRNGFGNGLTGDAVIRDGANDTSNIRAAALNHIDRLITIDPWVKSSTGNSPLAKSMYDLWRDEFAATTPRWTGRPDTPENPVDEPPTGNRQINVTGASSGTFNFRFDWMSRDYSTLPITDRQIQVSHDNVQFTDVDIINGSNIVGTAGIGTVSGLRPGLTNVRWRQRNSAGWSRWTPTWYLSLPDGNDAAAYKANRNEITVPGTASGTLTRVADPALHYNPYPGNEMPYFEPVAGGKDLSQILELHCGFGYWTGGTGPLSVIYNWQRSSDDRNWRDIGVTTRNYSRRGEDIGNYVRCRIVVNGSTFDTDSAHFPAPQSFDPAYLLKTNFDGMFEYEWPAIYSKISVHNASLVYLPLILPGGTDPEYRGGVWASKNGAQPHIDVLVTESVQQGTYRYKIVAGFGQYAPDGNSHARTAQADHVLTVQDAAGSTVWLRETIAIETAAQPAAYAYEGVFTVTGGQAGAELHVRFKNTANVGGAGYGSPGLLYIEISKVA